MIAGDTLIARARPWFTDHRVEFGRIFMVLLVLSVAWWIANLTLPNIAWIGIICYGIVHLLLIALNHSKQQVSRLTDGLALLSDASFAFLLLSQAQYLNNAIYPLYLLVALRVLVVYQQLPVATIIPFVLGPAYLFAESMSHQVPSLSALDQVAQWSLLLGSLWFGAVAIWSSSTQRRENQMLRQELRNAQVAADVRVAQLEGTTSDLRARMREQHALEEGLRVITSTLSLDEVLSQIIDSTTQMLSPARVSGIALSLGTDDTFDHHLLMLGGCTETRWADLFAQRILQQQVPLVIADIGLDGELAAVVPPGIRSALSVPLFVGEGAARGALTVISNTPSAFSSSDARHLIAFAIQAGIAIGNAEMHSQLRHQQHLLEAVVRDISDGLLVIDSSGNIVLANPLGGQLLDCSMTAIPVHEQLMALAKSMYTVDKPTLTCEIRVGCEEGGSERSYQALASQVRRNDSNEPMTAIVLHDITAQRDEERNRREFISMVAHELRNPLNSLNGFVKIVLQGRAGALTPLQQEFLEIVDSQADRLKGRISELLEFNRLDAGRLVLNPEWSNLQAIVAETTTRLTLEAEQAGLELINDISGDLPECYCDDERISQVLTNLVENAIKATSAGGSVRVHSEVHEDEVWIRVCDTGVGIPPEEQSRIFQPFYRAHDRTSSRGNHLGLGLAICQQIIEGHKGRIWAESEQGKGSCFTFALPYVTYERERALGC